VHQCEVLKCTVIAIGGVEDHVHLLVGFPPTLAVSELVKKVKGTSSHLVNSKHDDFFKWQGAYGAFTVSQRSLDKVADYIRNQEMHHQQKASIPIYELMAIGTGRLKPRLHKRNPPSWVKAVVQIRGS
jgi:putative transposase